MLKIEVVSMFRQMSSRSHTLRQDAQAVRCVMRRAAPVSYFPRRTPKQEGRGRPASSSSVASTSEEILNGPGRGRASWHIQQDAHRVAGGEG